MTHRRRRENNPAAFSAVTPHFFSIVLENTLRNNRLLIPKKFVGKYGETLSNPVFVKLPCGSAEWKMELKKFDGRVCFEKGWKEFADHYSIDYGDLLVFRYEGNSRFNALIFDTTTVEIDYSPMPSHVDKPFREEIKDDDSIEILEDFSPCPRKRESSSLPCSGPRKKLRTSLNANSESKFLNLRSRRVTRAQSNEMIREKSMSNRDSHRCKSEMKDHFPAKEGDGDNSTQKFTANDKVKDVRSANGFKPTNLTCKIVMKRSHVIEHYDLSLPAHFATRVLKDKSCDAAFKLSDGRTWPITFAAGRSVQRHARLKRTCWKKFAQDNNLKAGDVCIFELVNDNKIISFNVSILQAADNSYSHPSHVSAGENIANPLKPKRTVKLKSEADFTSKVNTSLCPINQGHLKEIKNEPSKFGRGQGTTHMSKFPSDSAFEAASRFTSTNPFFKRSIISCYLEHGFQRIPADFVKMYLGKKTQIITLQVGKKSWGAKFLVYSPPSYMLSGLRKFSTENSLRPGDVCIYELIKAKDPIVLKVSIFRITN